MSLLDMDERILDLAAKVDVVYSPLVDAKEFPEDVDVTLVEGAISTASDLEKIRLIRARTRVLVSLGDCAVTANVPSMRNPLGTKAVLERAYLENAAHDQRLPAGVPPLLERARPIHEFVAVDVFVPGCPPSADTIYTIVTDLLAGVTPEPGKLTRFGA
jgi:NAD-reducing hydrogenase small subunit